MTTAARVLAAHLVVVTALLLPFEAALFPVGPLLITTAELPLYLAIALWCAGRVWEMVRARPAGADAAIAWARRDPVALAALVWLAAILLAALLAPFHRVEAVKFALRALGGGLLFFAARDLARTEAIARRIAGAVIAGAVLSATAALLENTLAIPPSVWRPFRAIGFTAVGLPRASGTFAYPTIAAMYWEAALVLLAVVPWGGRSRRALALALAAAALLVAAIFASATRSALAGAALASAALLLVARRRGGPPRVRLAAAGTLGLLALFLTATLLPGGASDSLLGQRLRWWRDGTWYRVRYQVSPAPLTIPARALVEVPVTIENTGSLDWPSTGTEPVRLSYHWETIDAAGRPRLLFEGRRTPLPRDVPPGGAVSLSAVVEAPDHAGRYRLRWDLVREHVTWFSERGNPTADQQVHVEGDPHARMVGARQPRGMPLRLEDLVSVTRPTRAELWRAAVHLWWRHPLLGVGPDNFRRLYQTVMPPPPSGSRPDDDRLHANNLYLETLATTGLAGLAALALLAAAWARRLRDELRARNDGARSDGARWLVIGCGVAAGTFFVHGALDYFFEFTATYALFWLLLALFTPAAARTGSAGPP
jgi:hypothetical protein